MNWNSLTKDDWISIGLTAAFIIWIAAAVWEMVLKTRQHKRQMRKYEEQNKYIDEAYKILKEHIWSIDIHYRQHLRTLHAKDSWQKIEDVIRGKTVNRQRDRQGHR